MDADNSGSISHDEIGYMLRTLGQNPTKEEVQQLVDSVDGLDGCEKDGAIQLREFLQLYARGMKSARGNDVSEADCKNAIAAISGAPGSTSVQKSEVSNMLSKVYELDSVDIDEMFLTPRGTTEISLKEFQLAMMSDAPRAISDHAPQPA